MRAATDGVEVVIPAAGRATRMLPLSKFIPKELLPLGGVPALAYALAEGAHLGGWTHVVSRPLGDEVVRQVCDQYVPELMRPTLRLAVPVQKVPTGLAAAVAVPGEASAPRAVILPDEILGRDNGFVAEMVRCCRTLGGSVLAVRLLAPEARAEKGAVALSRIEGGPAWRVAGAREGAAPGYSDLSVIGRYVLEPKLIGLATQLTPGRRGELDMCDLVNLGIAHGLRVFAMQYDGPWLDIGTPSGYAEACVEMHRRGMAF